MSKKKLNLRIEPNLLIAIGVLVASFGALVVSIQQASIMNEQTEILLEQSKSNAWPSLSIVMNRGHNASGIEQFNFMISNRGTGPAIIEQTIITYNGKSFKNWKEFYTIINVPDSIPIGHGNDILYNRVISPNEDFLLIDWYLNEELMAFVYNIADKISIEICYKSVYGDYWRVKREGLKNNLEKNKNERIDFCNPSNKIVFEE